MPEDHHSHDDVTVRYGLFMPIGVSLFAVPALIAGVYVGFFGRQDEEAMIVRLVLLPLGVVAGLFAAYLFRIRGKPAMIFSATGLEMPSSKKYPSTPWENIQYAQDLDVKTPNGTANYLGIKFHESTQAAGSSGDKLSAMIKKRMGMDFDLVILDQPFAMTAKQMAEEINRRIERIKVSDDEG